MKSKRRWTITSEKFLNSEQVIKLLEHLAQERDLALIRSQANPIKTFFIIRTLLETGTRVFEFTALTNGDFSGHKLNVKKGKGNKPRTILLTKSTANLLKDWIAFKEKAGLPTDPMAPLFPSRYRKMFTTRGVQKIVKAVFKAAGLPAHFSCHSLRHTYCSLLLASGKAGLATVKENMGHSSIAITDIYSHAVGSLEHVEILPSSQFIGKSELGRGMRKKKSNVSVMTILSKANFK